VGGNRFRLKPCALAAASISLAFAHASLWANPTGPQVVSGQVNFQQPSASVLNVTNSPGAIINWQGFSIGAGEVTRFVQQSAASSVLLRLWAMDMPTVNVVAMRVTPMTTHAFAPATR